MDPQNELREALSGFKLLAEPAQLGEMALACVRLGNALILLHDAALQCPRSASSALLLLLAGGLPLEDA